MAGVKLLSDSDIFKAALAALNQNVITNTQTNIQQSVGEAFKNLPNEANGDTIPQTGLYTTGSGFIKVATTI